MLWFAPDDYSWLEVAGYVHVQFALGGHRPWCRCMVSAEAEQGLKRRHGFYGAGDGVTKDELVDG